MMRAALIVVGFGTLAVMELGTPPRTKEVAPDPLEQLTFDVNASSDTLTAADRLEAHEIQAATVQPSPVEPIAPPIAEDIPRPERSNTVEDYQRRANDKKIVGKKLKSTPRYTESSKSRPKRSNASKAAKVERSNVMVEVKPCRPNAFDSLLQALNLSSGCRT